MEKEKINILTNVIIAFSTWVGVGSALAVYLNQFQNTSGLTIILIEVIYILATILVLNWMEKRME